MIKTKSKTNRKLLKLAVAFLFPLSLFGGAALSHSSYADSVNYVYSYEESVSVTNSSFTSGATPYASGNSLSGWSAIETESKATGMIINVGSGTNSDNSENTTFSRYQETYMLNSNPGAKGSDQRILMINSKAKNSQSNVLAQKGYRSNSISLDANSYYRFKISVKTSTNGDDSVNASIYVSNLKNLDEENFMIGYENITTSVWKEYYIFIATGDSSQSVNIDLYLGSANGQSSYGAVFFDDIHLDKLSQNAFFDSCYENGYMGADNFSSYNPSSTRFLVNELISSNQIDFSGYNFDFEEEIQNDSNTLGESWSVIEKNNGHAVVSDIRNMQVSDFKSLTGYDYVGTDLSYNNDKALILYTKNGDAASSGYVGVKSKDINIKAHEIYKVSLKLKVSSLPSGTFYVKLAENEKIYDIYSDILSSNESDDNYYALQNNKTSGISSNKTNSFTNDYQTVEFYIKGHSLYNSSFNIELWLGDNSSSAQGCVVVDNISIEHANYTSFSSASNSLELKSFSSSPSTIANGYFNDTQSESLNHVYPVKANEWTTAGENERNNIGGVIYLYNNQSYNDMYVGSYSWAGIYPGAISDSPIDIPNNVYMMYNKVNSYQSITSKNYSLSENSYYKFSFNFYNQDISGYNSSKIKVEVIDEDGIVLFSKDNLSSADRWDEMNVHFHTAKSVSNNVHVVVSLGTEDNKSAGIVYLDNFVFESATEDAFALASTKVELDDYFLNLSSDVSGDITSSPAYSFSSTGSTNSAKGGIVSGNNNPYTLVNSELAIDDSNYLVLSTMEETTASLTSNYTLSLSADNFYKLTFDLATIFNDSALEVEDDYGVSITINGFDEIKNLKTQNELKSYTIFFKATSSTTGALKFSLVSESGATIGTALLTHINFVQTNENEYNSAKLSNLYEKTVFTSTLSSEEEQEPKDDSEKDDNNSSSSSNMWLLAPTIITAVALIIAIIAWAFRHVKIKKIEKLKAESYDKKLKVNHDQIYKNAQIRRDNEVKELTATKNELIEQRNALENEHREFIKENNISANGKISKDVEKKFKKFNADKNKLSEKINIIDEQIANVMTSEYLLSLERKIVAEQDDKKK